LEEKYANVNIFYNVNDIFSFSFGDNFYILPINYQLRKGRNINGNIYV